MAWKVLGPLASGATDVVVKSLLAPRTNTVTSSATPSINVDTTDIFTITALAVPITSMSSGLSGTPVNGQRLMVRFKDNGTARAIAWGTSWIAGGASMLLANTTPNKTHLVVGVYDSTAAKWVVVACDPVGY